MFAQGCSARAGCNHIRIDEPYSGDLAIWSSFVLSLGLLLGGCASAPRVKVAAEVFDREKAKSRSVAVVADLYMDDPAEADKLAELMRSRLTGSGFKVQETENEADLVIVPTIERSNPAGTTCDASSQSVACLRPLLRFGTGEYDGITERAKESRVRVWAC